MYVYVCIFTGSRTRLSLLVSGYGMRVLLVSPAGQVFLWECVDVRDLAGLRDGPARGLWAHIQPPEDWRAPSPQDKETSQHSVFVRTDVRIIKPGRTGSQVAEWLGNRASHQTVVGSIHGHAKLCRVLRQGTAPYLPRGNVTVLTVSRYG